MRGSATWPTCLPAADSVAVDVASRTAVSVRGRAVGAAPAADKDPPVGGGGDGHPYQCVPDAPVQFRRHQHSQPFCLGLILPLRTIRIRIRIPHCRIHRLYKLASILARNHSTAHPVRIPHCRVRALSPRRTLSAARPSSKRTSAISPTPTLRAHTKRFRIGPRARELLSSRRTLLTAKAPVDRGSSYQRRTLSVSATTTSLIAKRFRISNCRVRAWLGCRAGTLSVPETLATNALRRRAAVNSPRHQHQHSFGTMLPLSLSARASAFRRHSRTATHQALSSSHHPHSHRPLHLTRQYNLSHVKSTSQKGVEKEILQYNRFEARRTRDGPSALRQRCHRHRACTVASQARVGQGRTEGDEKRQKQTRPRMGSTGRRVKREGGGGGWQTNDAESPSRARGHGCCCRPRGRACTARGPGEHAARMVPSGRASSASIAHRRAC